MAGKTVITFGTFDVLHVGHVRVLNRSAALGDRLVVGVSSDALNFSKKGRNPVFDQNERLEIVSNLKVVDAVFVEESLEQKREYVLEHQADILVMGDDWTGKFDFLSDICEVVYLPRTPSVSTTAIIEHISTRTEPDRPLTRGGPPVQRGDRRAVLHAPVAATGGQIRPVGRRRRRSSASLASPIACLASPAA